MNFDEKNKLVSKLISLLTSSVGSKSFDLKNPVSTSGYDENRRCLRALMNTFNPNRKLPEEYFLLESKLLGQELEEKQVVAAAKMSGSELSENLCVYQGDITAVKADAIVNAANSSLLGCFIPGHNCIDNCIHSAAGLNLRLECQKAVATLGHGLETGKAIMTNGWNLPASHVIHTVGPIINYKVTDYAEQLLAKCYVSCFDLAKANHFKTLVFCCISTGSFGFPSDQAARVAVKTVLKKLREYPDIKIIFNTFLDKDTLIYNNLLNGVSSIN